MELRAIAGLVLVSLLAAYAVAAEPGIARPRLLVTPKRLEEIRKQIQIGDSAHQLSYKAMKARVDMGNPQNAYYGTSKYIPGYAARECAFMSLLATDPAEKAKYATRALKHLKAGSQGSRTLGRSMFARNMALTYNWAYPAWTDAQRAEGDKHVKTNLAAMAKITHSNLGGDRSSNFVGVIRGAEMILLLASGADTKHPRYAFLKKELARHIRDGFGSIGLSTEGMGYAEYPGGFLYPAIFACESIGDPELLKLARSKKTPILCLYTQSFQGFQRKFLQWGVGHGGFNEGYASAMLHVADEKQLPYLRYWYDRHMGKHSPMKVNEAFDGHRAGATLAMIYYPETVEAKDPTGVWPKGVQDKMGYHFFRNRWKDENDIMVSLNSAAHHHQKGWWQHEKFALNLMAYNTRFIGGPGKTRDVGVYSVLLVDGQYATKDMKRELDGKTVLHQVTDNGGYVIAGGGAFCKARGLDRAERHMLVDFSSPEKNTAIISTLDDLAASAEHTYTWQANLGSDQDDGDIKTVLGNEGGRPTFTLNGRNGWVKAWVLHPADAKVDAGDPLKVSVTGDAAKIWIVMHVGSGKVPAVKVTGTGMGSTLTVGGRKVSYDVAKNRIASR